MDYDSEITSLAAETLAIQFAITNVLYEIKLLSPQLADAIGRGFDHAASQVENMAIKAGKTVPPEHLVKALGIVEELRSRIARPPWSAERHRLVWTDLSQSSHPPITTDYALTCHDEPAPSVPASSGSSRSDWQSW